jgi:hypothetical protein
VRHICFNASSFASSRGEGTNKDYKHGVLLRTLTLVEAYDRVTHVHANKKRQGKNREVRAATSRVDSLKLSKQWFPDIAEALAQYVSGCATQLCHEEMGSNGNYRVVGCYDPSGVPEDDEMSTDITLAHVADVPEVDGATLDLTRFTAHLDNAKLAEKDPFRRLGLASFLASQPDVSQSKVLRVENNLHRMSQYLVFYDPVTVQSSEGTGNVTIFKSHWCACGMATTAGLPCRHFYASHRHMGWAGFHMQFINSRWHTSQPKSAMLWTYGNGDLRVTAPIVAPVTAKLVRVHCAGSIQVMAIPVDQQRHARQVYGNIWGKSRTVTSLICMDYGYVQERGRGPPCRPR